jgi:hypothetical protein
MWAVRKSPGGVKTLPARAAAVTLNTPAAPPRGVRPPILFRGIRHEKLAVDSSWF